MENENILSNNEVIESVENASIVEENILEDNSLEVVGDTVVDGSSYDTVLIDEKLDNIENVLIDSGFLVCSLLFTLVFFVITMLVFISLHFITERRKV